MAGKLSALGFDEELIEMEAPPEEEAGKYWRDFIANVAPSFRDATFEQIRSFGYPGFVKVLDEARYGDAQLREIISQYLRVFRRPRTGRDRRSRISADTGPGR